MLTQIAKLKILSVGPIQTNSTVKTTTRKCVLSVAEIPKDNPFGNSKEPGVPFVVEVYNHNIENFNISTSLIGEVADVELDIRFYKRDAAVTPGMPRFIVNDMSFRL